MLAHTLTCPQCIFVAFWADRPSCRLTLGYRLRIFGVSRTMISRIAIGKLTVLPAASCNWCVQTLSSGRHLRLLQFGSSGHIGAEQVLYLLHPCISGIDLGRAVYLVWAIRLLSLDDRSPSLARKRDGDIMPSRKARHWDWLVLSGALSDKS